ncbi:hypothetical protein L1887_35856 [Cichorium endivia]|nr:hypothetical protein L1887_35856 [Cichorium endivia]
MVGDTKIRGWTEIRRRKPKAVETGRNGGNTNRITTFFVTNVPDMAKKREIWRKFERFGRIVDAYMGTKKRQEWTELCTRDYRSYAEALRPDVKINEAVADPTPIILQKSQDKDENVLEIKYLGGLKVLLIFSTSRNVEAFIKDENRWNEYFKYEEGEIRSDDEDGDDDSIKEGDAPMLVDDRRSPADMTENSPEKSNGHKQTSLDERDSAPKIEETSEATKIGQVTDDIPNGGDPDQFRIDPTNNPATQPIQNLVGSLNGLVSSGCFGPFSSPIKQKSTEDTDQFFEFGGSIGKRRRVEKSSRLGLMSNDVPHIDLNRKFNEQNSSCSVNDESTSSMEAIKTAEIGRQLGFQIEDRNLILREVLGENGDNLVPK